MSGFLLSKYIKHKNFQKYTLYFCIQILVSNLFLILLYLYTFNFLFVLKIMSFNHYIKSNVY